MKIRLIQPAQLDKEGKPIRYKKLFFPNLTLPTIAGLTPKGIDVRITMEYIQDIDFDEDADLVGITCATCQAPRAYQVAAEFRKRGKKTIMGGIHATVCPEEALQHVDSVLVGEAEDLWETVIQDMRSGNLRRVYECEHKPDLSRLVIPRFDILNFDHYVIPPLARTPLMPIQATRGCPNRCDFCSVSKFFGHAIRKKPVGHVMKEIETIRPSRIFFTDDNIVADPAYSMDLFEALKPFKTRWACQMSTRILKYPDLIKTAADSGCHETLIGLESLNENGLKSINKGFNKVEEYRELFHRLADVGILAQASVIVGLDGENPDDIRRAVDTMLEWDINYIYIAILTPFPGTQLYERVLSEGRLLDRDWSRFDILDIVIKPKIMTVKEQEELVWELYGRIYSLKNIVARLWRFKRQYVRYMPRDNAVEETFFQLSMRNAVKRRMHPFSLGLRANGHAD